MHSAACRFALSLFVIAAAAEGGAKFAAGPTASRDGDGVKIAFTVSAPTDVEVAVLGADGKVVRSLAAGVLGASQPPPSPLKPGLAQEILWDGAGDWGKKAEGGPFKARVRLGMGAQFGRILADGSHNLNETVCRGLAVDPANGDLYVMAKKTRDGALYFLRVYDRQGNYLRELMPYPAAVGDKSREVFGCVTVPETGSKAPISYHSLWPTFYPVAPKPEGVNDLAIKLIAVHPTEDAVVLLAESFASLYRIRKKDGAAVGESFAEPLWDAGTKLAGYAAVGPVMGAFGPDAKAIYFAGYAGMPKKGEKKHPAWPSNRVYKMTLGGKVAPFAELPLPDDARPPERGWSVLSDVQPLHGIAVAKDGTVMVCDAASGKIWLLSPEGKVTGSIAIAHPHVAVPDHKTGALYVLTRQNTDKGARLRSVVKLSSCAPDAKVVATLQFSERGAAQDPFLVGDFTGQAPQLWLSGCPRENSLLRIEDKGDKLEAAEDLADRDKLAAGFACRLDVDAEADLAYVHNGWGYILRYSGLTGEYAGPLDKDGRPKPIIGSEFCLRRDGMVYLSGNDYAGGGFSGPWRRLNRDLTPAPLPDGRKEFSDRYGKMGGGYFGNQGSCVTPDGTLYYNGMFTFRVNGIFEVKPDGSAGRCPRLRAEFASGKISPHCVKAGFDGALIGWLQDQSGGVEVDQQGNIYAGVRILPRDYKLPDALAEAAKRHRHLGESLGSVIKFRPSGGGMVPDNLKPGQQYKVDKYWPILSTVPDKLEDGIKMASGQRLDWYNPPWTIHVEGGLRAYPILAPFSNQCACQTPRFDVDDFGRLYIPNALTCSVQVVDNEGNHILTFGAYGNRDSQGPESKVPEPGIPLAYPVAAKASFKHIYVADSANRRVVRVDPTWAAEEACTVH
ncbi:MAG: hypothetical protein FJ290_12010 [Planctomycetes bacterium]|nr:hypothetical protein [Planctomycetota bacterium]